MHSVLLHVEKPTRPTIAQIQAWQEFPAAAASIASQDEAVETLGEGCWLISLEKSVQTFVALASAAQERKLAYRVLFLQDAPQWIHSSSTP